MSWAGWEDFVPTQKAAPKCHKYGAKATVIDGLTFASKKEARRYTELKLRLHAGDIRDLRLQPRYVLYPLILEQADVRNANAGAPSGRRLPVADYVADFQYEASDRGYGGVQWRLVVEDVKGVRTDIYKLKKRWFEAQYGITVVEI